MQVMGCGLGNNHVPSNSDYMIRTLVQSLHMQESTKQLHFLTKVTGILADTFSDIHRLLQEQSRHSRNHNYQPPSPERPPEAQPLSISNSDDQQNGVDEEDVEVDNKSSSNKPKKVVGGDISPSMERGTEKKKKTAKWQAEGKPRPPLNAFMLFLKASKSEIMQARPQLTPAEVSTYASSLWGELPNDEKEKYRNEYRENRSLYKEMMDEYHRTIKDSDSPAGRKKRNIKNPLKTSKNDGGQEVVNIESDEDNSGQI